jgi:hypothetical protein
MHHRWRAHTLGRRTQAVVVAGCFTAEQKRSRFRPILLGQTGSRTRHRKNLSGWERAARVVGGCGNNCGRSPWPLGHANWLSVRLLWSGYRLDRICRILPDVRHGRQSVDPMPWWRDPLQLAGRHRIRCVKRHFRGVFVKGVETGWRTAAYWVGPWPRFREMTPKSLHDDHTTQLALRTRRSRHSIRGDEQVRSRRAAERIAGLFIPNQTGRSE